MNQLSQTEAQNILSFLGYGNPAGKIWFIGLEEGLGNMDEAEAMANLHARGRFQEVMDLAIAHLTLIESGQRYDLAQRASFNQVWLWISKFARAIEGASNWEDVGAATDYIRRRLARSNDNTFMTYASPIPEKGLHTRQWTELLAQVGVSTNDLLRRRHEQIASLVNTNRPATVICHGATHFEVYRAFLPQLEWRPLPGIDRVEWAQDNRGSYYILTPFFGNGQMSWPRARALVAALRQGMPSSVPSRNAIAPDKNASGKVARAINSASKNDRFIDHPVPSNPKETVALLDYLVECGFTDDAFWRLHHKRLKDKHETIRGFRSYCLKTQSFEPGGNNWRVHERLVSVLRAYVTNPSLDFSHLAQRAFRDIPSV